VKLVRMLCVVGATAALVAAVAPTVACKKDGGTGGSGGTPGNGSGGPRATSVATASPGTNGSGGAGGGSASGSTWTYTAKRWGIRFRLSGEFKFNDVSQRSDSILFTTDDHGLDGKWNGLIVLMRAPVSESEDVTRATLESSLLEMARGSIKGTGGDGAIESQPAAVQLPNTSLAVAIEYTAAMKNSSQYAGQVAHTESVAFVLGGRLYQANLVVMPADGWRACRRQLELTISTLQAVK